MTEQLAVVDSPDGVDSSVPVANSPEATSPDSTHTAEADAALAIAEESQTLQPKKQSRKSRSKAATTPALAADDQVKMDALRAELSNLRATLEAEQEARTAAEEQRAAVEAENLQKAEAARMQWLTDNGLVKEAYAVNAPGVAEADPFTEEGRRVLAKFRADNPELFKGSPEKPKGLPAPTIQAGRHRSWGQLFKEAIGR